MEEIINVEDDGDIHPLEPQPVTPSTLRVMGSQVQHSEGKVFVIKPSETPRDDMENFSAPHRGMRRSINLALHVYTDK